MNLPEVAAEAGAKHPEWKPKGQFRAPVYSAPSAATVEVSSQRERNNALAGLKIEAEELSSCGKGQRNDELNRRAWKMCRKYVAFGQLTEREVYDALMDASRINGHVGQDGPMAHNTLTGVLNSYRESAAAAPVIEWRGPETNVEEVTQIDGITFDQNDCPVFTPPTNGHTNGNGNTAGRHVLLKPLSGIIDDLPDWVWHAYGKGRIQLGTLCMLAGRPGAGKSTAARWFAAQLTNGTLPGIWQGQQINVAYLAAEEQLDVLVKPSLRAVGADMDRIFAIAVEQDGMEAGFRSIQDEAALIENLIAADVRAVIIDPIMATIAGNADIYKNNEVRSHLEPFPRIAQAINGVVFGIAHLNKQAARDVVAGINGSSAFGEVPRAVFGFAKDDSSDDDDRIMSQSKNSAGAEDLALIYRIETTTVTTEARGRVGEMAYFNIIGQSTETVEEVMSAEVHSKLSEVVIWLEDMLEINGPMPRKEIIDRGRKQEDYSVSTIKRAFKQLGAHSYQDSSGPQQGRRAMWSLKPPTTASVPNRDFSEKDHTDED